jgi:hypothetical protein
MSMNGTVFVQLLQRQGARNPALAFEEGLLDNLPLGDPVGEAEVMSSSRKGVHNYRQHHGLSEQPSTSDLEEGQPLPVPPQSMPAGNGEEPLDYKVKLGKTSRKSMRTESRSL